MSKFFAVFLIAVLVIAFDVVWLSPPVQAQTTDHYRLDVQGAAWNRTTLSALLVPPYNESWWNPLYLNAALRAIGQWNDAIAGFASNYSDYSYLSSVNIQPVTMNRSQPNFDIYINWTQFPPSADNSEVGLTKTFADNSHTMINSTISLATHTSHGDAQNIALHELGHGLDLGHSNYTSDLMYPTYTLRSGAKFVSTLDCYGVAAIFAWLQNPAWFYPVDRWLSQNYVILPSSITFKYLPVSSQNARPQTLENNPLVQFFVFMFEVFIHPEIAAITIVIIVVFVVLALIPARRRKRRLKVGS